MSKHVLAFLWAVKLSWGVPADYVGWIVLADDDTEAAGSTWIRLRQLPEVKLTWEWRGLCIYQYLR